MSMSLANPRILYILYVVNFEFRWNDHNVDHIDSHNVSIGEAEGVVNRPIRGYPKQLGDGKFLAKGQTVEGRYLQVIYIFSPPGVVYVIHARDMTPNEKRRLGRRRK
jgi:uncharacterized DUF497 family protein